MQDSDQLKSAFVGACEAGDQEIVNLMLPWVQKNNVNCADSMGVTGLMAALENDQHEVVGLLLDLPGLDFSARDSKGRTVLDYLLRSKFLFYFEEILEELDSILMAAEVNDRLLIKLTECLAVLKDNTTLFKRLLPYYDINYKNGELLNRVMKLAGESTILAVVAIMQEVEEGDGSFEFTRDNLVALATAAAAGHTELIRFLLRWHGLKQKDIDMELFIALCREKGVKQENINRELTQTICGICRLMVVKFSNITFELIEQALMILDINYQDQKGETILMKVLTIIDKFKIGHVGLRIVERLLKMEKLDLNLTSKNGKNALDFLRFHNYQEPDEEKDRAKDFLWLSPVVNCISSKKGIPENIMTTLPLDIQLLNQFQVRQHTFKDFDFNLVQHSLLSQAMKALRLDLVKFLIIDCNVKVLLCDLEVWRWLGSLKIEDMKWCEVKEILGAVFEKIVKEEQRNTMAETDKITVLDSETLDIEDTSRIAHGQARRRVRVKKKNIQRLCLWALSKLFF